MIVWKATTVNPRLASFRYRVALPALYLERSGVQSRVGWHPRLMSLEGADAIVFSKTFQPRDLALARVAYERGIPIICDLCDNIFVDQYPPHARAMFGQLARMANVVVASTPPLAAIIADHLQQGTTIVVIPDSIERQDDTREILRGFRLAAAFETFVRTMNVARKRLREAARKLRGTPLLLQDRQVFARSKAPSGSASQRPTDAEPVEARRTKRPKLITWFGNHGGDYSDFGMLDILMAAPALESIAHRIPIKLRVISNNLSKFNERIASLKLDTEYIEWAPETANQLIRQSDVVILPSTLNEFTRCKSANRLLLALHLGVPVVATRTPASADFEGCLLFDDWERNIETYLRDDELRQSHIKHGAALIARRYTPEVIAREWMSAIQTARQQRSATRPREPSGPRLILLVNLVQDLELILPIYQRASQRPLWETELWVTTHDLLKRPEMWKRLEAARVPYHVVEVRYAGRGGLPDWDGAAALISASESTAAPHRQARKVVKLARRSGVRTYTLQHGFQNVGLTYGDESFPVRRIRFASDVIFLWGTLESLHPDVSQETRSKCVAAGCPKPVEAPRQELPRRFSEPIIAVFENLHSPRYTNAYRERFLEDLIATMRQRPDLRFVIKPHPAGQFLTTKLGATLQLPENAIIADPRDRDWINISAADILGHSAAVITSVTTVAFDAARLGKPVAIVVGEYARDISAFSPLSQLKTQSDWAQYLKSAVDARDAQFERLSAVFAQKTAVEGDAIRTILDHVEHETQASRVSTEAASARVP